MDHEKVPIFSLGTPQTFLCLSGMTRPTLSEERNVCEGHQGWGDQEPRLQHTENPKDFPRTLESCPQTPHVDGMGGGGAASFGPEPRAAVSTQQNSKGHVWQDAPLHPPDGLSEEGVRAESSWCGAGVTWHHRPLHGWT